MKKDFSKVKLYFVTSDFQDEKKFLKTISIACKSGIDCLQLRLKNKTVNEILTIGSKIKKITKIFNVILIINDRADICLQLDADGVHLGQDDGPIALAKKILSNKKIIGRSCHSLKQALQAQKEGADYISCGPIFSTPTKPDYKPVGLNLISKYEEYVKIPYVAIGGIDLSNVDEVLKAGARRIAVVRAIQNSKDVATTVKELKEKIKKVGPSEM